MTIGKKLYLRFGAILAIMLALLLVNIFTVRRQFTARSAVASTLFDVQTIESVRYKIMENRLALGDYLLSGDRRDEERIDKGISDLRQLLHQGEGMAGDPELRGALSQVEENEHTWADDFAKAMMAKRHQVDAGKATIADLEAYYLQQNPGSMDQQVQQHSGRSQPCGSAGTGKIKRVVGFGHDVERASSRQWERFWRCCSAD